MSSLLKFFKKKIRPFKKCVCQASVSFEEATSASPKPPCRVAGCREMTTMISTTNESNKPQSSDVIPNGLNPVISVSTILFNTPNSSPSSCTVAYDDHHYPHALSSMDEECCTTTDAGADTYTMNNSNIDYNRAARCSGNPCFIFDSISNAPSRNLTPSSTASGSRGSNQSMVTYKTKYGVVETPHVNEDDGLVCISLHQSILSQQSTPYNNATACHDMAAACKLKKSSTFNYMHQTSGEHGADEPVENVGGGEHFRRSNTTYTLNNQSSREQTSNQIRDYFTHLEMRRPVKRKANVRKLNDREAKQVKVAEEIYDNMEKLQDAFFNDESTLSNEETMKKSASMSFKGDDQVNGVLLTPCSSNKRSPKQDETVISPPRDDETGLAGEESHKSFASISSDSSNVMANSSVEKLRRISSLSKQLNVSACMNMSRASFITREDESITSGKQQQQETSRSEEKLESQTLNTLSNSSSVSTSNNNNITETLVNDDGQEADGEESSSSSSSSSAVADKDIATPSQTSDSDLLGEFKRGEPNTRLSKNIKQMFRNIVRQQMEALTNLEKFYESQAARLEADRQSNLLLCPANKDRINAYYQTQLKSLEERVHVNLQQLIENKSQNEATTSAVSIQPSPFYTNLLLKKQQQQMGAGGGVGYLDELIRVNQEKASQLLLNHKLSQLMLLKQIHVQKHTTTAAAVVSTTNRSRPLVGLKSNLTAQNNQHLLPTYSKQPSQRKSLTNEPRVEIMDFDDEGGGGQDKILNDSQMSERVFKRNLSLPFKQRHQARLANVGVVESTILRQQSRSPSNNAAAAARFKLASKQAAAAASKSPVYTRAIQTMSRKCSSSNDNLAADKMMAGMIENVNVLECGVTSAFAHIKRQNKSLSSVMGSDGVRGGQVAPCVRRRNEEAERTFCTSSASMHSLNHGYSVPVAAMGNEMNCSRMLKYVSPRLSDGHLQYRIKLAGGKSAGYSNEHDVKSLVETQV